MTKKTLMILAVATLLGRPLHAQMQVDNAEIWLTTGQLNGLFTVTNAATGALQFNLVNGDWDRADDGQNRFYPAGSTPNSCERALEVFPRQLRLAAGASQQVRVSLRADSLPSRACWSIVFVESEPPVTQERVGVRFVTRIGVKIYYNPAESVQLAEMVEFVQLPKAAPADSDAVELAFRNIGTRPIMLGGSVEVRRADNFVVGRIPLDPIPVLPSALRVVRVTLPTLQPGAYIALGSFDFGGDEDLVGQTPVVIR